MQTVILYTQAKYLYTRILYGNKLFTIYKCNTCATQAVAWLCALKNIYTLIPTFCSVSESSRQNIEYQLFEKLFIYFKKTLEYYGNLCFEPKQTKLAQKYLATQESISNSHY